jgi:hypothetical protein
VVGPGTHFRNMIAIHVFFSISSFQYTDVLRLLVFHHWSAIYFPRLFISDPFVFMRLRWYDNLNALWSISHAFFYDSWVWKIWLYSDIASTTLSLHVVAQLDPCSVEYWILSRQSANFLSFKWNHKNRLKIKEIIWLYQYRRECKVECEHSFSNIQDLGRLSFSFTPPFSIFPEPPRKRKAAACGGGWSC